MIRFIQRIALLKNLEARIQSFELAYRMQSAAPGALDLDKETEHTKKLYEIEKGNLGNTSALNV